MRARGKALALAGLGAILLAAGCATPVKTDYKTGTNFAQYRTFALLPLPQQGPMADPAQILRLAQPAGDAVTAELKAKGLNPAPLNQADLAVNIRGQSLPKVEVRQLGYTYPVMTRYGMVTVVQNPYSTVSTTHERTLVIELLDNHTKELVWVGWLKKESSKAVTPAALQDAIREILAKFPPAASS